MISQSCFDIKVIVNELSELANARIEKFYNTSSGELLIKGYSASKGKFTLRALRGECIHLTDFKREVPDNPSGFTMLMRKYLSNSMILEIYQPYFERIVIMKIKKGAEEFFIAIELFNKGNIAICSNDFKIINSLKSIRIGDKFLRNGDVYDFAKPVFLESYLDRLEFKRIIKSSSADSIVKCIAIDLGVGGRYAEEVCCSSGIEFSKSPGLLSDEDVNALFKEFSRIYMNVKHYKNISAFIYLRDEKPVNFSPMPFNSMAGLKAKPFSSFNQACDYYYSNSQIISGENENEEVFDSKINNLKARLFQQENYFKELESESERLAKIGKIIFENSSIINPVIEKIRDAKNSKTWEEISLVLEHERKNGVFEAEIIKSIDSSTGVLIIQLSGAEFPISINDDAFSVANNFFEKSKKLKGKIQGALVSAGNTRMMIEELKNKGAVNSCAIVEDLKPEKKWYEKYRWLKTANGFLFVCGKDAVQNEIIVKKIAEPNDLIFHASVSGSPFGVLKKGVSASEEDKNQAANFILCFSRAWRESILSDVFCVEKEQVSKTAPSGEYVSHGSFIISGRKEFFTGLKLELGIGIHEEKAIAGPVELIESICKNYCILKPGGIAPGKIAKRLIELFDAKNLTSEEYLAFIPGDCLIELP
ncbi:MAG: ribosome rescue protein RqcH [Candidatus Nanoarchaeia archaeon]|nr:ribosome rescue protein RqcH [Candidatus Nanoarchaeia archaeon]